jgi:hypothetical protein
MDRQMFKKGGAAGFPDLSGDGQVTQRDILMGRGVIKMQQGGMAPMPAPMPAGPGPEVMAGAMGQIDPNSIDINQAAQGAMQQGIDPAMLEGMLGQYASQMDDLENAEDYEQVINGIRGDTAPIEQRYMELAGIVGQEDAQQTPESVLALVQPVMLMASVDQGIGGLAMDEMNAPVEGAMAEGIMSTVNMGAQEPTQGLGGPAPVNFNQGGPVVYMADGGDPLGGRLGEIYGQKQSLYSSILSPEDSSLELEQQTDMTKAQILFDIAQGALMFATPGERRMSPAERLAQAFTPVLGNISARAGELEKFKQGQRREERLLNLQALGAAETTLGAEEDAAAKARLQEEANNFSASESRLNRAHDITVKNMDFDFQNKDRLSQQDFTTRLQDLKFQNDVAILGLQNDYTVEGIQIRNKLEQDNLRLSSELRIAENTLSFDQQLQRDGVLNSYELERMDKGHGFNLALASHKGAIDREAQVFQNTFTAAESALDRAQRENLQLNDQNFRQLMQQEMQKFTSDQAEIDRAINKVQSQFDNDLALRGADRADATLSLQERAQVLDETYKLGMLSIEQLVANATKLGSEAKTSTITYLTNPDRLDKYANGTLGDDATTFEQLVLDYIDPKNNEVYDAKLGRYVKGSSTQLAPRVLAAIQKGNPTFYSTIAGQLNLDPSATVTTGGGTGTPTPTAAVTTGGGTGTPTPTAAAPGPAAPKNLGQATSQIFNPDGTVNEQSEVWSLTKPNRFDENIDYGQVIGLSRLYPGLVGMASEGYAELADGVPSEAAQMHKRAQADLTAFANDMLQFSTNLQGDRVLKFVQELIEQETKNLRPGGLLLKTNADAVASLEALRNGFEQAMQIESAKLTEYGGDSSGYKEDQVTNARSRMDQMKVLYNELLAFERGFASPAQGPGPVQRTEGDQSVGNARLQINQMRKR